MVSAMSGQWLEGPEAGPAHAGRSDAGGPASADPAPGAGELQVARHPRGIALNDAYAKPVQTVLRRFGLGRTHGSPLKHRLQGAVQRATRALGR